MGKFALNTLYSKMENLQKMPQFATDRTNFKFPFKTQRVHQLNKTELLVCVALGWRKKIAQYLKLTDSYNFCL